jgi:hypothetical protein
MRGIDSVILARQPTGVPGGGQTICEQLRCRALSRCKTLNLYANRLDSSLYVGETLLQLILVATHGDVGLLMRAHKPASPRVRCGPDDGSDGREQSDCNRRI